MILEHIAQSSLTRLYKLCKSHKSAQAGISSHWSCHKLLCKFSLKFVTIWIYSLCICYVYKNVNKAIIYPSNIIIAWSELLKVPVFISAEPLAGQVTCIINSVWSPCSSIYLLHSSRPLKQFAFTWSIHLVGQVIIQFVCLGGQFTRFISFVGQN